MNPMKILIYLTVLPFALWNNSVMCPKPQDYDIKLVSARPEIEIHAEFIQHVNPKVPAEKAMEIAKATKKAAAKYKLPREVLVGLMDVESSYRVKAKSNKEAVGLMQVHTKTWLRRHDDGKDLISVGIVKEKSDLYDIRKNIDAGAYILAKYRAEAALKDHNNPMEYALTRYFGGKTNTHYSKTMRSVAKYNKFKEKVQNAKPEPIL